MSSKTNIEAKRSTLTAEEFISGFFSFMQDVRGTAAVNDHVAASIRAILIDVLSGKGIKERPAPIQSIRDACLRYAEKKASHRKDMPNWLAWLRSYTETEAAQAISEKRRSEDCANPLPETQETKTPVSRMDVPSRVIGA